MKSALTWWRVLWYEGWRLLWGVWYQGCMLWYQGWRLLWAQSSDISCSRLRCSDIKGALILRVKAALRYHGVLIYQGWRVLWYEGCSAGGVWIERCSDMIGYDRRGCLIWGSVCQVISHSLSQYSLFTLARYDYLSLSGDRMVKTRMWLRRTGSVPAGSLNKSALKEIAQFMKGHIVCCAAMHASPGCLCETACPSTVCDIMSIILWQNYPGHKS